MLSKTVNHGKWYVTKIVTAIALGCLDIEIKNASMKK